MPPTPPARDGTYPAPRGIAPPRSPPPNTARHMFCSPRHGMPFNSRNPEGLNAQDDMAGNHWDWQILLATS